jgi:radical SAM-linked protein
MRFASHRDVARAVERGVRRAGLPIAYSAGFTPHARISYAGAAPTGTASEAEYLELSLTQRRPAAEIRERLDAALPDGMDVIEVTEAAPSLAALALAASLWQMVLPGVAPEEAASAVADFLGRESLEVERLTNKGTRRVDARAAVVNMWVEGAAHSGSPEPPGAGVTGGAGNAILRMVVRHVVPAVRPDEILTALRCIAALAPSSPARVTRLAQGTLDEAAGWHPASGPGGERPEGFCTGKKTKAGQAARQHVAASPAPPEAGPGMAPERSVPAELVKTTRHGDKTAVQAGTHPGGACYQLPRGADGPLRTAAPGGLTGDSPDARERAARQGFGK